MHYFIPLKMMLNSNVSINYNDQDDAEQKQLKLAFHLTLHDGER